MSSTASSASPAIPGAPPGVPGTVTRPGLVLLLSSGATFIAFLDTTVVNVAFPDLATSFPADRVSDLSWVVSSYAVLFAALLTPMGRIADAVGRKRVFLLSLSAFTVASALCAAAPDLPFLIVARALQGAAAAGMIPAALGLVLATTPPARLAAAIGAWGAAGSMASAAGPALGGVLVDVFGWRAVFLINIPVGAALVTAGIRGLPERRGGGRSLPDPFGTGALTAGIALLVLGLTKGSDWNWDSAATIGTTAGGAALGTLALLRSVHHSAPAVETGLFGNRTFAVASTSAAFTGAALFAWLLSGPLFLTSLWHYSVLKAGFAVTPGALTSALAAVAVGRRAKPHHLPFVVGAAMAASAAVGVWGWLQLGTDTRFLSLWLPMGLVGGAAFGGALTALSTAAATALPPAQFASGLGMSTTARQLGGALGAAATGTIIAAHHVGSVQAFRDVYLACALLAATAASVGLAMTRTLTRPKES
ncbi:drug resistance transporter, EmrB/QacA subfamily [Actinacidiphila yanglinensis]|uniref:Drug resistance transporter, EmrB/QacA subfamily n=1 Tax=Actinacidiphila yanglinensis TaxID=310779 RepID=A0A1H6BBS2_9ACTN|nr:MFS transporter [Actinacidiphila yanglinensis]SEG58239.1 drug resistance transporter, EmrB/QacA subfamily [Actinacidiphila yanglinensis]